MKRYLHNAVVVLRTALRLVIVAPLAAARGLGILADKAWDHIDHMLPGIEEWKSV